MGLFSGSHREGAEKYALVGYYAASSNFLPTFRDSLSAISPEDGTDRLSRNVGKKLPLRNKPEERSSQRRLVVTSLYRASLARIDA